jgi:hypothetical protein
MLYDAGPERHGITYRSTIHHLTNRSEWDNFQSSVLASQSLVCQILTSLANSFPKNHKPQEADTNCHATQYLYRASLNATLNVPARLTARPYALASWWTSEETDGVDLQANGARVENLNWVAITRSWVWWRAQLILRMPAVWMLNGKLWGSVMGWVEGSPHPALQIL